MTKVTLGMKYDALIQDFEVVGHTHSQYALKTELLGYFPYTTDEVDAHL